MGVRQLILAQTSFTPESGFLCGQLGYMSTDQIVENLKTDMNIKEIGMKFIQMLCTVFSQETSMLEYLFEEINH